MLSPIDFVAVDDSDSYSLPVIRFSVAIFADIFAVIFAETAAIHSKHTSIKRKEMHIMHSSFLLLISASLKVGSCLSICNPRLDSDGSSQLIHLSTTLTIAPRETIDDDGSTSYFLSDPLGFVSSDAGLADDDHFFTVSTGDDSMLSTNDDDFTLLTDATLENSCAAQNTLTNEQLLPLTARDAQECLPSVPLPLPFTEETLELFQDPLNSLNRIPSSENEGSSPVTPKYPGLHPPEKQTQENEMNPEWNTDPIDGEEWKPYAGKLQPPQEIPCERDYALGFIVPLCCAGGGSMASYPGSIQVYDWIYRCDPRGGT